jgi:hypothetical protein
MSEDFELLQTQGTTLAPAWADLARASDGSLGKPGHSFVAIGVELDNGELVYERLLGYYPKSDTGVEIVKAIFSKTSGDLTSKLADVSGWPVQYRVSVSDDQRQAALAVADKWIKDDPQYNLFANGGKNCSAFAAEVAQAIGLGAKRRPIWPRSALSGRLSVY